MIRALGIRSIAALFGFAASIPARQLLWLSVAVCQFLAMELHGQAPGWQQLAGPGPSPRAHSSMVYVVSRDYYLLFGGFEVLNGSSTVRADTWKFQGGAWALLSPPVSPGPRANAAMAYDSHRDRVVMFGGFSSGAIGPRTTWTDTWEWDPGSETWNQVNTPAATMAFPQMAYDPERRVMVMAGHGSWTPNVPSAIMWEYSFGVWTLTPTRRPSSSYILLDFCSLVFDANRKRVLLVRHSTPSWGGLSVYEYVPQAPDLTTIVFAAPSNTRQFPQVWYDSNRSTLVVSGGNAGVNVIRADTFEIAFSGGLPISYSTVPSPERSEAASAYNARHAVALVVGGYETTSGGVQIGPTLSYAPTTHATYSNFGLGCAGSLSAPSLTAMTLPAPGSSFDISIGPVPASPGWVVLATGLSSAGSPGSLLPIDLAGYGMPGCSWWVSTELVAAIAGSGGSATYSLAIPASPLFLGLNFFQQAFVLDASAGNQAGVVTTDVGVGVVR